MPISKIGTNGLDQTDLDLGLTGNVGIGTATPAAKLHVAGGDLRLGDNYAINWGGIGSAIIGANNTLLRFDVNGAERMRISNSGSVTTPYQPAFFAVPTAGFTTTAPGSYFSFNSLSGTFCSSNRSSGYNTSTLVYTAPVAGLYQFYVSFYMNATTISAQWFKNGVGMSYGDAALMIFQSGTATQIVNGTVIVELAAGDYIGVQPRSGSATVGYYGGHSCFFGYLIG